MEIVPIIYKFLIIGGILLTFVIIISFILSKSPRNEEKRNIREKEASHQPMFLNHNLTHNQVQQPIILPINALQQREIKVVRRQSYEELDNSYRTNGNPTNKNGNRRYTILNDEIKSANFRNVNQG
jgi:hypothetical protein